MTSAMLPATLEVRLGGGYRMFWSTIRPAACGRCDSLAAPEFFPPGRPFRLEGEPPSGLWDLWPIDNPIRPNPLEQRGLLCRPVRLTDRTLGVALISLLRDEDNRPDGLWIELFLSSTEPGHHNRTVFEDWAETLRTVKDDPNRRAVLRLNLGLVGEDEISCFRAGRKLVCTELTLEIRPGGKGRDI